MDVYDVWLKLVFHTAALFASIHVIWSVYGSRMIYCRLFLNCLRLSMCFRSQFAGPCYSSSANGRKRVCLARFLLDSYILHLLYFNLLDCGQVKNEGILCGKNFQFIVGCRYTIASECHFYQSRIVVGRDCWSGKCFVCEFLPFDPKLNYYKIHWNL